MATWNENFTRQQIYNDKIIRTDPDFYMGKDF